MYLLNYIKNKPFCFVESIFGRVKLFTLSFLGEHPYYKWAICFDLNKDPSEAINLNDYEFKKFLEQSPKIIKNLKLNKSPLLLSYEYSDQSYASNSLDRKLILKRYNFIKKTCSKRE